MNVKSTIFLIWLLILNSKLLFSQKFSEMDTLRYETMVDKQESKNFKTGMDIKVYIASDKNSYTIGDTLVLENPTGESQSAFSKKRNFNYVFYGKPSGTLLKGLRYVEEEYKDYKLTIEKIQFNKGTFGLENYVFFYVKPLPNSKFTLLDNYITVTMVDNAIAKNEIKPLKNTKPLTRDEAINLLKKKKEEVELGISTQEEYDKLKETLTPIIKAQ